MIQPTTTQTTTQQTTPTTQRPTAEKDARAPAEQRPTAEKDARAPAELCSFFGIENAADQACILEEPEFIVTEMTLDTGATTHAADRIDFPEQEVKESAGSKAGQTFGCAGGKRLANEGEVNIVMIAPGGLECELDATIQITKITRPLLSVFQMTKTGDVIVVCKKDEAVIVNQQHEVLAVFKQKGGLYVADMRVRNPRFKHLFGGPAR